MEISLNIPQPRPRNVAKGDRWIGLATLTDNPRCGWVVVVNSTGEWRIVGDCWEKHEHGDAALEAVRRLTQQSQPEAS